MDAVARTMEGGITMSDLISRQDALDALGEEPPVWYDGEDEIAERNQWRRDVNAIKAVQAAYPEPHWIPCSERLPEEGREVLACLTDWKTGEQRRVVSYRIDFNMWHGYGRYNEKCVAWMPLPEPWKGGDTE